MAMDFRITADWGVDAWSFYLAVGPCLNVPPSVEVEVEVIDRVAVSFIDERFGNPTRGVWYLTRSQFEAVPMRPRVTWRLFVQSECHTLTTSAGIILGVLPRDTSEGIILGGRSPGHSHNAAD